MRECSMIIRADCKQGCSNRSMISNCADCLRYKVKLSVTLNSFRLTLKHLRRSPH